VQGVEFASNPFDMLGRPRPLSMPVIVLEEWARGMAAKRREAVQARR